MKNKSLKDMMLELAKIESEKYTEDRDKSSFNDFYNGFIKGFQTIIDLIKEKDAENS